jgi:subtilisin family serine protease
MTKSFSKLLLAAALMAAPTAWANGKQDVLVKLAPGVSVATVFADLQGRDTQVEVLADRWVRVQVPAKKAHLLENLKDDPSIEAVQPNYPIHLLENYQIEDSLRRAAFGRMIARQRRAPAPPKPDNLPIPAEPTNRVGADPLFSHQWGMIDIGAQDAWKSTLGNPDMIVAVIDTGVDYTHEDLLPNLWRNRGEMGTDAQGRDKSSNGVDDDGNGYVDDLIGWDFFAKDNKPYDLAVDPFQLLMGGGNPGHGTHCAGNVAARGGNAIGISGVAPNVKIMSLRFISEKGQGTTADAILAIKYAVDNGAKVMSNSWGSEGEDPNEGAENKALRDAIQYAQDHGVLFIAAAGNGHNGKGYDNDTDKAPAYPASYDHDIIISVAALDNRDQLGGFSNWGRRTVDLGAPGVAVYSTTVGGQYNDKVIDVGGFEATWDGTSMATPHVAGAAALYWSAHPEKSWQDVKAAILNSVHKIPALNNKSTSGGKLDVRALMK